MSVTDGDVVSNELDIFALGGDPDPNVQVPDDGSTINGDNYGSPDGLCPTNARCSSASSTRARPRPARTILPTRSATARGPTVRRVAAHARPAS